MDMQLLQREIDASGMPMTTISERSSVPRATIYYRIEHPETWKVIEMMSISKVLKLTRAKQIAIFDLK